MASPPAGKRGLRRPIELGPADGAPVLLLHGLTGSPWDLEPLAVALAAEGRRVSVPRLMGHASLEELDGVHWWGWYRSAEQALWRLFDGPARADSGTDSGTGTRASVLGFSMGSLLALRLAAHYPRSLASLITLGVPFELPRWKVAAARALANLRRQHPELARLIGHHRKGRIDARSQAVAEGGPSMPAIPYSSVVELAALQAEVRAILDRVRAPLLLLHGRYDHAAPAWGSVRVSQRVSSAYVQRVEFPNSCHNLARDLDRDGVREHVLTFIRHHHRVD